MLRVMRLLVFRAMITAGSIVTLACVTDHALAKTRQTGAPVIPPTPTRVVRPIDTDLLNFAAMLRAYVPEDRDLVIEVDFIPNISGIDKELPDDLGSFAQSALDNAGRPIVTFRTLDASAQLKGPAGNSIMFARQQQKRPIPAFRLEGTLRRASEQLVQGGNARIDLLAGKGHGQTDGSVSGDNTRTVTYLTVSFNLVTPDGLSVLGADTAYRIPVERSERNRSLSIYVGGSGIGGGKKLTITQDTGDALYDATAASVMHLIGNALLIPYYRCSSVFSPDQSLDNRVRYALLGLTRTELEQNIKKYLYVDGYPMDMTGPGLTESDRSLVVLEMKRRSLDFTDRSALGQFAFQLWQNLDYLKGAERIDERMAQNIQMQKERQLAAKASPTVQEVPVKWVNKPLDFKWEGSVRMVVLDMSRIKELGTREKILAAAQKCVGCDEIRTNPDKTIAGIRISSQPSEVQGALRRSRLPLEYLWTDDHPAHLVLVAK